MARLLFQPGTIERSGDDSPARSLYRYVWRMSGRHQFAICPLAAVVAALTMVPLELQRRIINEAIADSDVRLLGVFAALYLAVVLLQSGLKFALRLYQGWLGESAIRYGREHLSRIHAERKGRDTGRAVSIIGAELEQVGGFVGQGVTEPLVHGGMLVAILGYMLVVEPLIALVSLGFFLPQVILWPLIQRAINRLIERRVGLLRDLGEVIAHHDDGSDLVASGYRDRLDRIFRNRIATFLLKFSGKAGMNVLNGLAPLSALVFGGYLVIQGETSLGVVVAFISGFQRMAEPLRELIAFYRLAAQTRVKHRMIARWM